MKNSNKKLFGIAALGLGAVLLSSCTQSFCSASDTANMAYPYEQGVTVYCAQSEVPTEYAAVAEPAFAGNTTVYKYIPFQEADDGSTVATSYKAVKAQGTLLSVLNSAQSNGFRLPSKAFFAGIDQYVLEATIIEAAIDQGQMVDSSVRHYSPSLVEGKTLDQIVNASFLSGITVNDVSGGKFCINPYKIADYNGGDSANIISGLGSATEGYSILRRYGEVKFSGYNADGNTAVWANFNVWVNNLRSSLGIDACPSADFENLYVSTVTSTVSANRSCIATKTDENVFGHYGSGADWEVRIESKDWGYAFSKGFLEGLLVYPVSWLVDTISYGLDPALSGTGQIWAIVIVTLVIRFIMMAATFKNTLGQQKMQALQPQLAKLQQKYPNSNTNQAEKQRLSQEQMALYKRNKINPMGTFVVMLFQFPIFICVWSALQGSAALSSGEFLGMRLSDTIQSILVNTIAGGKAWYANANGWWTALVLFLLMAGGQFLSMFLPQLITKIKNKKVVKLSKNPAQDKQNKQMKWITYGMLAMTIVMGFFLPSAMGVYWFIGAIVSMIQTGITQAILAKQANKKKRS